MSDDEFMMDEGEEDFEYEDDGDDEDGDAGMENKYYNAKAMKGDDPDDAIREFEAIVDMEEQKGDWGFKALKQLTKTTFKLGRFEQSLEYYKRLLPYTKSAVTRNYAEKSINSILDYVSASSEIDTGLMQKFYDETNRSLSEAKNERLSMKTNLKLAKLWLDRKEYGLLGKIIKELHSAVKPEDPDSDSVDNSRGTLLLEIAALEIQMYTQTKNTPKLKEVLSATMAVKSAIPHPRIMGIIRECGGKMHMAEREYEEAQSNFVEAFRNYDEAGSPQRTQVLKYLVLAHMLTGSDIDPFDSQETKPYKNDRQIQAMRDLQVAYQNREVHLAEKVIRDNRSSIMDDPFIREHLDDVLVSLRTQWILDNIKGCSRLRIGSIAKTLGISYDDVVSILSSLILDGRIKGSIDDINGRLELDSQNALDAKRYSSMSQWVDKLEKMQSTIIAKAAQSGPGSGAASAFGIFPGGFEVRAGGFD